MKQDFLYNILAIIVCFICILLQAKNKSTFIKGIQMQNYIWLFALVIYLFNIVQYYPLNESVYTCAVLYILSCNVASLIFQDPKRITPNDSLYKSISEDISCKNRINKCIIASIICWCLSIGILQKSIQIIVTFGAEDGLNALRYRTYGDFTIFSTFELMLITYLIRPVFTVTTIFFAEQIAFKKVNTRFAIIALLNCFWLILATAGRALLVSLVIYIFLAVIAINGLSIVSIIKKYRRYIIPSAILAVIIIQIISKRINRNNGFIAEGIIYYFSGLSYFSTMINEGIAEPYHLLGKGTFSFIIDLPVLILKFLGFSNISGGSQYLSNAANPVLSIGNELKTNATASSLFTFYSDFGVLGSIIGGLLIGGVSRYVEKNASRSFTPISFARYLFILNGLAITMQNYPFVGSVTTMTWIFIGILLK